MKDANAIVDVAVVGAGAAGIGAAKALRAQGRGFVVLEASHRIGGRAYTEYVETAAGDAAFDLGCHWMHSASLNPFVQIADSLGFEYSKGRDSHGLHLASGWADKKQEAEQESFFEQAYRDIQASKTDGRDISIAEATDRESRWTAVFDYWMSLYHSADSDQVSSLDSANYRDTEENWPLKQGYGSLIARFGADVPVELNSAVESIDWSGSALRLRTHRGEITAKRVIVTVSTGILGAGDIRFTPHLPPEKQEAIAAVPLGNHNRICLVFDRDVFGPDTPVYITSCGGVGEPMSFGVRPFGHDYVESYTGGRFADWLERAGTEASVDLARENLAKIFGGEITRHIVGQKVTAWGGDLWVKGAYSAALPGQHHARSSLGQPVGDRLFFAGEATSPEFFSTAHGAYQSGQRAAREVLASLAGDTLKGGD